jgi:molybdopterin converting factor small subunit
LTLDSASVRAALLELEKLEPALYGCVCDETGAVRRHVNLFVNDDHIRDLAGLDTALKPGDLLLILASVSGG